MKSPFSRRAVALLFASALVFAACGDDDDAGLDTGTADDDTTTTTDPVDSTTTAPEESPPADADDEDDADDAASEDGEAEGTVLDVSVAGGEVTGGGRHEIDLGETVTIRVTSDVADHIHLHGYDVLADVPAGGTADLTFDATIPGVFEVELEDSGIPLLELEIS